MRIKPRGAGVEIVGGLRDIHCATAQTGDDMTDLHLFIVDKDTGRRFKLASGTRRLWAHRGINLGQDLDRFLGEMAGMERGFELCFIDERNCSVEELAWLSEGGVAADKG